MKKIKDSELNERSALSKEISSKIYEEIYHFLKTNHLYDAVIDKLRLDNEGGIVFYELPFGKIGWVLRNEFRFCINKVIFPYYVTYLKENNLYCIFRKYHIKDILIKYFAYWTLSVKESRKPKIKSWYYFIFYFVLHDSKKNILNNLLTIDKRWNGNKTTDINH